MLGEKRKLVVGGFIPSLYRLVNISEHIRFERFMDDSRELSKQFSRGFFYFIGRITLIERVNQVATEKHLAMDAPGQVIPPLFLSLRRELALSCEHIQKLREHVWWFIQVARIVGRQYGRFSSHHAFLSLVGQ